jgi:hypothetical protein
MVLISVTLPAGAYRVGVGSEAGASGVAYRLTVAGDGAEGRSSIRRTAGFLDN